jgi:hypothetical protein
VVGRCARRDTQDLFVSLDRDYGDYLSLIDRRWRVSRFLASRDGRAESIVLTASTSLGLSLRRPTSGW